MPDQSSLVATPLSHVDFEISREPRFTIAPVI